MEIQRKKDENIQACMVCMYDYGFVKYAERLMEIPNHPHMSAEMQD